jgi:hypothetical protein
MYPPSINMKHTLRDDVKRDGRPSTTNIGMEDLESQQKNRWLVQA